MSEQNEPGGGAQPAIVEGTVSVGGRSVAFADHGGDGTVVLWCHGGPGNRYEASGLAPGARALGLRVVGIDRPGYGRSDMWPGRTIAGWVPDAIAVADAVGADRFAVVGVSTGGAYALATAALHPDRVVAVVACCALTDMRWDEGREATAGSGVANLWDAGSREEAVALAEAQFGGDGSDVAADPNIVVQFPPADLAVLLGGGDEPGMAGSFAESFRQGVAAYADDRLADGPGWHTFDVSAVRCPVAVVHGALDPLVPLAQAHHTAEIVPGASLHVFADHGHLSIVSEVPGILGGLLSR